MTYWRADKSGWSCQLDSVSLTTYRTRLHHLSVQTHTGEYPSSYSKYISKTQLSADTYDFFAYDFFACDFTSTNGDSIFACALDDPVTIVNTSVTGYYGLAGNLSPQTTETNAQITVSSAFQFSQLTINITSNSITSVTSLTASIP